MSEQDRSGAGFQSPITIDDLIGGLTWPTLLRAPMLALAPGRIGLAFFLVVVAMVVRTLAQWVEGPRSDTAVEMWAAGVAAVQRTGSLGEFGWFGTALYELFIRLPVRSLVEHPWVCVLCVPVLLVGLAAIGGAICRSAACEFSAGVGLGWPQALGFGVGRLRSSLGAMVGPLVIVWSLALGLAVAGLLLLRAPGVNLIGGLGFGLFLVGGFVAVLMMVAYLLGQMLLIPAVACDGADSIDAVQRSYAAVTGRPIRLVLYGALLIVEGVIAFTIASAVTGAILTFVGRSAGTWAGEAGRIAVAAPLSTSRDPGGTAGAAHWLIRLWTLGLVSLVWAYVISLYFTGSTLLYLALRRVTYGQDMSEVWMPGMVEGTGAKAGAAPAAGGA